MNVATPEPESNREEPNGSSRSAILLLLVIVICACMLPLVIAPGARDNSRVMENISLLSSQETWLRLHGFVDREAQADAWILPHFNGRPRLTKPPMMVWLHLLAWIDLTPDTATPRDLIVRARYVAAFTGAMTIAGIFFIGVQMRGPRMGTLAALIAGSCILFEKQARTAAYDIHLVAWTTLAIAALLWAIQPFDDAKRGSFARLIIGSIVAGLCTGAAVLTKAPPLAAAIVAAPTVIAAVICRGRFLRLVIGLVVVAAVAFGVAWPWFNHVGLIHPEAWDVWLRETQAERPEQQPFYYYLILFAVAFPWTVWLIAALIHPLACQKRCLTPFSDKTVSDTFFWGLRLFPFAWFALVLLLFSIPGAKQERYILPIVPPMALQLANLLLDHAHMARRDALDSGGRLLMLINCIIVTVASIALPIVLTFGDYLSHREAIDLGALTPLDPTVAGVYALLLIIVAIAIIRLRNRTRPYALGVATALWAIIAFGGYWQSYEQGPTGFRHIPAEAARLQSITAGRPIFHLTTDQLEERRFADREEFLFYLRRVVGRQTLKGLNANPIGGPHFLLVNTAGADLDETLQPRYFSRGTIEVDKPGRGTFEVWESR